MNADNDLTQAVAYAEHLDVLLNQILPFNAVEDRRADGLAEAAEVLAEQEQLNQQDAFSDVDTGKPK